MQMRILISDKETRDLKVSLCRPVMFKVVRQVRVRDSEVKMRVQVARVCSSSMDMALDILRMERACSRTRVTVVLEVMVKDKPKVTAVKVSARKVTVVKVLNRNRLWIPRLGNTFPHAATKFQRIKTLHPVSSKQKKAMLVFQGTLIIFFIFSSFSIFPCFR